MLLRLAILLLAAGTATAAAAAKVKIPGGVFLMGDGISTKGPSNGALQQQTVKVGEFEIDATAASNEEFAQFVRQTGYQTDSDKFKWSFVLDLHATEEGKENNQGAVDSAKHWLAVPGATWAHPQGPGSFALPLHPAVHLSYNDAKAYCEAQPGGRLPTESEWERAARGGLKAKKYPWGDGELAQPGDGRLKQWRANVWQGEFPQKDAAEDGYSGTCPVDKYAPNAYGLYNTVGNVWEWTSSDGPREKGTRRKVLRGASFVDSPDGKFNHEASVHVRMLNTEDSASSNTGVRCAYGTPNAALPGYRYPKEKPQMDQDTLNKIVEEGGVEALQEYLGGTAQVMTAGELMKQKDEIARQRAEAAAAGERDEV